MQTLRNAAHITRFVLVWFALSIGVAIASPVVNPQPMELICGADGAVRVLVQTDEGLQEQSTHHLDCSLCLPFVAPPPAALAQFEQSRALPQTHATPVAAHTVAPAAAPLPARGPPAHS